MLHYFLSYFSCSYHLRNNNFFKKLNVLEDKHKVQRCTVSCKMLSSQTIQCLGSVSHQPQMSLYPFHFLLPCKALIPLLSRRSLWDPALHTVALGKQAQRLLVVLVGKDSSGVHPTKTKGSQRPRSELQAGGRVAWTLLGRKGFGNAGWQPAGYKLAVISEFRNYQMCFKSSRQIKLKN